jgi:choline kinase
MTRALILAAGQGERLRPLTKDKPKCLVELCGKSILERQIRTLNESGVDDIHILTGYQKSKIESIGFPTTYNSRFKHTNMVVSMFKALKFIEKDGDLLISYGDIVFEKKNLDLLLDCDDDIAIMTDIKWLDLWNERMDNPLEDAETLILDKDNYIIELGKKPSNYDQIQGQYTGLIKIKSNKTKELIEFYKSLDRNASYDNKNFDNMYMTTFIQLLINAGWGVKASLVENGWLEIDSVNDLYNYEQLEKKGLLSHFYKIEN